MTRASAVGNSIEFESAEFGLRVREDVFDRRELQQVARIARAEAQALPSIDHCAAESQSDRRNSIGESHGFYWIEVVRAHHAARLRTPQPARLPERTGAAAAPDRAPAARGGRPAAHRSEEHTSELQSLRH